MPHTFDTLDPEHMEGVIGLQVIDADQDPNRVLEYNRDWFIKVDWTLTGKDQSGRQDVGSLGGEWSISAVAESIGPGQEAVLDTQTVPLSNQPATSPRSYTTTLTVPAQKLEPGAYKLTVLVNYSNLGVPKRMAAFAEGPVIQIFKFA
ncbi:MAG: hypothetical protein HY868_08620 [Chloroflexi bacterium]|nr:hypothetical protein [Chloroflexota bacterium]